MSKKVTNLKKDSRNLNIGTDGQHIIDYSIEQYGYGRSILVNANDEAIAGNHVLDKALRDNAKIKVVETDGSELVVVKRIDIKSQSKEHYALAIADNRTTQANLQFDLQEMANVADEFSIDLEPLEIHIGNTHIDMPDHSDVPDASEAMETDFDSSGGTKSAEKEYTPNQFPLAIVISPKEKLDWDNFKKNHKLRFDSDAFLAIFKHALNTYKL